MNYAKIGFGVAIGWCVGKAVFKFTTELVGNLTKCYIPEKYRNVNHPDNPMRKPKDESTNISNKDRFLSRLSQQWLFLFSLPR